MGFLDLVGRITVTTSGVGDEVPAGALPTLTNWDWHYAAHTTFMRQLCGQQWLNMNPYHVKKYFKSCIKNSLQWNEKLFRIVWWIPNINYTYGLRVILSLKKTQVKASVQQFPSLRVQQYNMSFKNIKRRENCCRISTVQRGHDKQARISRSSPFEIIKIELLKYPKIAYMRHDCREYW
jgi:hypothetical protein